jgi:Putative auto-transporter adhesin, head GIN domain/Fibronectin type III domain
VTRSRRWLISAAFAPIALAVTAMAAGPATAAVPGPPTSVTAHAGDHLAEVTWNAPTPDDPTITGYVVTPSPADTPAVTVDHTARTATVTGLTNGTAYSFTVAATNPDGTGPPSDPSPPITPVPPAATTLTLAASPTSVLHGGTVQLTGRLQQTNTAEGIVGETLTLERRPKGTTSTLDVAGPVQDTGLRLQVSGGSRVAADLGLDRANAIVSGGSHLELTGTAGTVRADGSGASDLELAALSLQHLDIRLSGASRANVKADQTIAAQLSGASRLTFKGSPRFTKRDTSGASTIKPAL